ncbi:prenyltransferase [Natronococcus pandeyae]|nr:prenyltransferase [Natronococcus pandeyae]
MATAGPPRISSDSAPVDPGSVSFLETALVGVVALLPVAVAIHYANEYADSDTDALADRTPFSGGSGALVRTGLPDSFLRSATLVTIVIAALIAVSVTAIVGLSLGALAILVAILLLGLAYSLPPVAFVRRGVGEVVNAVLGGLLLPLYGVTVVASPRPAAVLAVVPFTLLIGCNLFATHWPDRVADAAVGKRTLAVRWSPTRIRRGFTVLSVTAILATGLLWITGVFPNAVAVAHLAPIPFLLWGRIVLARQHSPFPAVLAMVVLAVTGTVAWWWVGIS